MVVIKKKQMTNRLYGSNGGWAAIREIIYDGIGNVYGLPYHQISPIVSSGEWNEMIAWLVGTYGPSGTKEMPGAFSINQRWYVNNARIFFKDKEDLEWFLLRWS